jgi:hypothetical protein
LQRFLRRFIRDWWATAVLLLAYVVVFNVWFGRERLVVTSVGAASTVLLAGLVVFAAMRKYFVNVVDLAAHALVVLDVGLEAALLPSHDDRGFYLCALAFAVVLGGYRRHKLQSTRPRRFGAAASPSKLPA